jgi:chaperonin GroES
MVQQLAQMAAQNPPQTDAGQAILQQLTSEEQQQIITNAAETYNLAKDLDDGLQKEIGQEVYTGYNDDNESRSEWLDEHTFWLALYMQQDYADNSDSERSWGATESIPILTEACDQFQTRTYKAMFPNDSFVSAIPMRRTPNDEASLEDRAGRIGHHMSYQLGFEDRAYKQDKDALFLGMAVHGSFFTKTYFNESTRRFKVDNIRPTDFVVNYHVGPTRLESLRRKTHIIYSTVGETQDLVTKGYLTTAASPAQYEDRSPYNVKVDETQGLAQASYSSIKRDAPAVLLEQHFYLDLDDSGLYRPYIATICAASRKLLRLVVGYDCDPLGNAY